MIECMRVYMQIFKGLERGAFMNFMDKFEKKFGKYTIPNISLMLIICYVFGYLMQAVNADFMNYLTLNPYLILKGQVWRIVTWILVPPSSFSIFTLVMLYFYYSIGTTLERVWGAFRYDVYLISGMLFTVLGSFILIGVVNLMYRDVISAAGTDALILQLTSAGWFSLFSTYYINMSIFLAFAATFPDMQVLLMFIIPIKVKWMGIIYAAMLAYEFIFSSFPVKIVIGASLLNFMVFFFTTRKKILISPKQMKRRQEFKKEVNRASAPNITKHKCAICGRTEQTNPELEFRFCSKCEGNYEYCQEHLFTHEHIKRH